LPKFVPEHVLERIRDATDIVALVSEYLPLKKSGRSFKALCPFHEDKDPSFSVNPERQSFYCFGCGKGGDVFTFVMEQDSVSFPEAVEMLARKAGVDIPRVETDEDKTRLEMYRANRWAEALYHRVLLEDREAGKAREYLQSRGFDRGAQVRFGLGYAPGRSRLVEAAMAEGMRAEALTNAGLARRAEDSSVYDYFFGRIMFPIRDVRGRTVGFGGRTVDGSEPKYINTAETELFSKGKILYGLDAARGAIRRKENVFLTEGYTDVLMAQLKGIENAVAVLGTAVGPAHARIVKRYTTRATMVFDADEAGVKALQRSAEVFLEEDLDVYVLELPKGTDLCSFLSENDREAFNGFASRSESFVSHTLRKAGSENEKLPAVRRLAGLVSKVPDPIRRDAYLVEISRGTDISLDSLRAGMASRKVRSGDKSPGGASLPMTPERFMLEAMLSGRVSVDMILEETNGMKEEFLDGSVEGRLLRKLLSGVREEERVVDVAQLLSKADEGEERDLAMRIGEGDAGLDYEQQFRYSVQKVKKRFRERLAESLRGRMRDAKAQGDEDKVFELLAEYNKLAVGSARTNVEG